MKTATKAGTEFLRENAIDRNHIFLEALSGHTMEELLVLRNLLKTYEKSVKKVDYSELGVSMRGMESLNQNSFFLNLQILWKLILNPLLSLGLYTYSLELFSCLKGSQFCGWRVLCEKAVFGEPMCNKGMFGIILNSVMFIVQVWWAFVESWTTYTECNRLESDWKTLSETNSLKEKILALFKKSRVSDLNGCEKPSGWVETYLSVCEMGQSPELNIGEIDVYITKQILRLRRTEQRMD